MLHRAGIRSPATARRSRSAVRPLATIVRSRSAVQPLAAIVRACCAVQLLAAIVGARSAVRPAAAGPTRAWSRRGDERGQATVEVVALLPVIVVLLASTWQAALAGHAFWAATTAARAAARAHAVGGDAREAARVRLPRALERGLRVTTGSDGGVEVRVRIPPLPGLPSPGHAHADARFEPQR